MMIATPARMVRALIPKRNERLEVEKREREEVSNGTVREHDGKWDRVEKGQSKGSVI